MGIGEHANPFLVMTLLTAIVVCTMTERTLWNPKQGSTFFECDTKYMHGQPGNTFPNWMAFVINISVIAFTVILNLIASPLKNKFQPLRVAVMTIMWMLIGVFFTVLIIDILKKTILVPRPSFFYLCNYKGYKTFYDTTVQYNYNPEQANTPGISLEDTWRMRILECPVEGDGPYADTNYCLDQDKLPEAYRSMPSGHAASSFVTMTYFMCELFRLAGILFPKAVSQIWGKILLVFVMMLPMGLAAWIAASRVYNYRHSIWDIIVGTIIGFSFGLLFHAICHGFDCCQRNPFSGGKKKSRNPFDLDDEEVLMFKDSDTEQTKGLVQDYQAIDPKFSDPKFAEPHYDESPSYVEDPLPTTISHNNEIPPDLPEYDIPEAPHSHDAHIPLYAYTNRSRVVDRFVNSLISLLSDTPSSILIHLQLLWFAIDHQSRLQDQEPILARFDETPYGRNSYRQQNTLTTSITPVESGDGLYPTAILQVSKGVDPFLKEAERVARWLLQEPRSVKVVWVVTLEVHVKALVEISKKFGGEVGMVPPWHVVWRRYEPHLPAMAASCNARCIIHKLETVSDYVDVNLITEKNDTCTDDICDVHDTDSKVVSVLQLAVSEFEKVGSEVMEFGMRPPSTWNDIWHIATASETAPVTTTKRNIMENDSCDFVEPALAHALEPWLELQRKAVKQLRETGTAPKALVYRCTTIASCGGHGDRLAGGIYTTFLLAVASNRAFFIDSPKPVPLHVLLQPRRNCNGEPYVDWRVRDSPVSLSRAINYVDALDKMHIDIDSLINDPAPLIIMNMNQRVSANIWLSRLPARVSQALFQSSGEGYPLQQVFSLLFEPSAFLQREIPARLQALNFPGGEICRNNKFFTHDESENKPELYKTFDFGHPEAPPCEPYIAIHFRTGDQATAWTDPQRHGLDDLPNFLACAASLERELNLPADRTRWLLFADTPAIGNHTLIQELESSGKLLRAGKVGAIHIDRSNIDIAVRGVSASWAEWFLLASAEGAVLSASGFGVTATEVGRIPSDRLRFFQGCIRADNSAP